MRVWRAFQAVSIPQKPPHFTYVDVGANHPFDLSITASLHQMGWRGILVEADAEFAEELRRFRPLDKIYQVAASNRSGQITFYQVAGTGLGTLSNTEAAAARAGGLDVVENIVPTATLDFILADAFAGGEQPNSEIHFMSIDVEGAETQVLEGLDLSKFRPWVLCIEAIDAKSKEPSHHSWQEKVLSSNYRYVAFDGINRWFVADEHSDLADALSIPLNPIDIGLFGWMRSDDLAVRSLGNKSYNRVGWQRGLILNQVEALAAAHQRDIEFSTLNRELASIRNTRGYKIASPIDRVIWKTKSMVLRASQSCPKPINSWFLRKRHLRIVNPAKATYTDQTFLQELPDAPATWIDHELKPEVPHMGCGLGALTAADIEQMQSWLTTGQFDGDLLLDKRIDGHDDELGRTLSALRTRLRLARSQGISLGGNWLTSEGAEDSPQQGGRVLFDARSLQTSTFGSRGIGRFALAALQQAQSSCAPDQLVLLTDPALNALPPALVGQAQQVSRITPDSVKSFSLLIQPSPMTSSPEPLIDLLHRNIAKVAIVFDFIPMHHPTLYLKLVASRVEYARNLDGLAMYSEFICISRVTSLELNQFLLSRKIKGRQQVSVAWPDTIELVPPRSDTQGKSEFHEPDGPIIVMTGDESRKNTFGALAAIGVATSSDLSREVLVIGMAHRPAHVHHLSIAAAMRPEEAKTLNRISDSEMRKVLKSASLIVVPTFDEGLSLPILEAVSAGTPIVASDIPAHRELIGRGGYLVDPADFKRFARAIRKYRDRRLTARTQMVRLSKHRHERLEAILAERIDSIDGTNSRGTSRLPDSHANTKRRLNVGLATPWAPQKSGVADFSTIIGIELARLVDLTVYTTADANPIKSLPSDLQVSVRPVESLFSANGRHDHDLLISVVGNSHFHLPFIELTSLTPCVVVAHDTRMNELYMALRGEGGLAEVMLRSKEVSAPEEIFPALEDQIADMRLLQNAALWEVSQNAQRLIIHSPSARERIERETGVRTSVLTFPNYRAPNLEEITEADRQLAKQRLGFDVQRIHMTSLGFVDVRTKMSNLVIETAAWLQQWGYPVSLHLVGAASKAETETLEAQAKYAGLEHFEITGYLNELSYRDHLLATDVGVQLRISSLLGVSGPLGDLAGFGVTSVASSGLVRDVDPPSYVHPVPEYVSPISVAQAVENALSVQISEVERERLRVEYLDSHSPAKYAKDLESVLWEIKSELEIAELCT